MSENTLTNLRKYVNLFEFCYELSIVLDSEIENIFTHIIDIGKILETEKNMKFTLIHVEKEFNLDCDNLFKFNDFLIQEDYEGYMDHRDTDKNTNRKLLPHKDIADSLLLKSDAKIILSKFADIDLNCLTDDFMTKNYSYYYKLAGDQKDYFENILGFEKKLMNDKLDNDIKTTITESSQQQKKINNLLKVIYALAKEHYEYDPLATRNKATGSNSGSISSHLEKHGININNQTIKSYLDEAKKLS